MKLLTFLAVLFALPLGAQEPPAPSKEAPVPSGKAQVQVDVLMVSVPEAKGLPLISKLRDPKTVEATQAKLVEMIAAKEAELIDWPEVTVGHGDSGVSENILEQRYPAEFEGPQVPSFGLKQPPDMQARFQWALGMLVPTTFETRNTGASLQCECEVSKDYSEARLQIAASFVHLLRMEEHAAGKTDKGDVLSVRQPLFRTTRASLNVTLRNGERRLLLVAKPKEPEGTLFFFIAGVQIDPPMK